MSLYVTSYPSVAEKKTDTGQVCDPLAKYTQVAVAKMASDMRTGFLSLQETQFILLCLARSLDHPQKELFLWQFMPNRGGDHKGKPFHNLKVLK